MRTSDKTTRKELRRIKDELEKRGCLKTEDMQAQQDHIRELVAKLKKEIKSGKLD